MLSLNRLKTPLFRGLLSLFGIGLLTYAISHWLFVDLSLEEFLSLYADRAVLRRSIEVQGQLAPLAFVSLQALQVVLAPIPGEFTGAVSGFIFGGFWGTIYATLGLALGSSIAFWLGRLHGQPLVERLTGGRHPRAQRLLQWANSPWSVILVFLIPGIPKDVLTYLWSLTPMGFLKFFFLSQIGRLPGTCLLAYFGHAAFQGNLKNLAFLAFAAMSLIFLAWWFHRNYSDVRRAK